MAREAKIIYTAEDRTKAAVDSVKRGVGQVGEMARLAGFSLAALGGAGSIAAMVAMVKSVNDGVDALNDLSDATGSSIENISALEDVASRNGHAFESVSTTLVRFNQVLSDTRKPGSDAEKVLKALGLNAQRLRELDPAEALHETAVAFGRFADDGNKARAMQELFGKSTKEVAAFVKDLAEQQELNATLTTKQTDEAEKFNKQLFAMQTELRDVGREIAKSVVPEMANMLKYMRDIYELGGLWAFIGSGAELASLDAPFRKITELEDKLAKLASDREKIAGSVANNGPLRYLPLFGTVGDLHTLDEQIKQVEKQLDFFRRLDGRRLQEAGAGALQAEMDWFAPRGSVNVPDGPDSKAIAAAKKEMEEQAKVIMKLGGLTATFIEDWNRLNAMYAAGTLSLQELEAAQADLLSQQPAVKQNIDAEEDALRRLTKANSDAAKVRQEYIDGLDGDLAKLQKELDQQRDHNAAIGLGKEAIAALEAARLEDQATILHGHAIKKLDRDLDYQAYDLTMQQVEALRELSRLKREGAARESQFEIATRHQQEQIDLLKQTDEIARDVFVSIATEGGDAFKAIGRSIKANVINMLYQMTLRPFVIQLAGSLMGANGSAIAQAIGGNGLFGKASGAASMYNAGSSLFGGGLTAPGSAYYGFATSGLGQSLGLSNATAIAGNNISAFAPAGTQLTGLGAAMPYVAAAIAIASLLSGSFKGETRVGGVYHNTDFQAGPSGGQIGGATQAIGATIASINSMLGAFGSDQQIMRLVSGLEQSERGKGFAFAGGFLSGGGTFGQGTDGFGWQNRRGSLTAEEAMAAFGEELQQATLQALAAANLPGQIGDYLRELGDIDALAGDDLKAAVEFVNTYATNVQSFRALVEAMPVARLRDVSMEVANSLVTLSGGFEAFAANFSTYVDNFYSDEEKRAQTISNITRTLTTAGFGVTEADIASATREQFRAWVEGVDLSTDAGRNAYAALLAVSGAFASITELAPAVVEAVADLVDPRQGLLDEALRTKDILLDAYDREAATLRDTIAKHRDYARSLREARDALFLGDASMLSANGRIGFAQAQFENTLALASAPLSSDPEEAQKQLEAIAKLQGDGTAYLQALEQGALTREQYQIGVAKVAAGLTLTAAKSDSIATIAQRELDLMTRQLEQLGLINTNLVSFGQALANFQVADKAAQEQGIYVTASALYAGNPNATKTPDADGLGYWQLRLDEATTAAERAQVKADFDASVAWVNARDALNGSHANGLDYVPFNGYRAELHEGERVKTAAAARAEDAIAAAIRAGNEDRRREAVAIISRLQNIDERLKKLDVVGPDYEEAA